MGWSSSTTLASVGTALSVLVIVPLLDISFSVLMGADLSAPDLVRTSQAAALVALATSIASGIVGAVASDRNRGVFEAIHSRRRLDLAYWIAISALPTLLALLTTALSLGAILAMDPTHDIVSLGKVLLLVPATILISVLLGIAAAGIGVDLPDPYLGATLLAACWPLFTGVIVPLRVSPDWLQIVAVGVPLSGVITALDSREATSRLIVRDLVVAMGWAVLGLALTRHALYQLRTGVRRDIL